MNKMDIKNRKTGLWLAVCAAVALVAMVAIVALQRGGPDEEVVPEVAGLSYGDIPLSEMVRERMSDPDYLASIHELTSERLEAAAKAHDVRQRMQDVADTVESELVAELAAESDSEPDTPPDGTERLLASVDPALFEERVRKHPDWEDLEAEMDKANEALSDIQVRAYRLVHERMNEQVAERQARAERPSVAPLPQPEVKPPPVPVEEQLAWLARSETIILTNVPPEVAERMPEVPERGHVDWWPGKERGVPNPMPR